MARSGSAVAATRVVDKQERQINLVLALLNTSSPLALSRLRKDVPGYDGGADAVRQKFERDKRELRTSGIEIRSIPIESDDQVGYRIDPASFWLPDLGLDEDEARALGLAAATLGFGGDGVSRVLLDAPPAMPAGTLTSLPALPYLYRAIAGRCAVVFTHKEQGAPRRARHAHAARRPAGTSGPRPRDDEIRALPGRPDHRHPACRCARLRAPHRRRPAGCAPGRAALGAGPRRTRP